MIEISIEEVNKKIKNSPYIQKYMVKFKKGNINHRRRTKNSSKAYVIEFLCKKLNAGDVVIMDNLSSHKVGGILEAIAASGAEVRYLPPYNPYLNPIEKMWSKIKAILRGLKARTNETLEDALAVALNSITAKDAIEWNRSCGYTNAQT